MIPPRNARPERRTSLLKSPKYWLILTGVSLIAACAIIYFGGGMTMEAPFWKQEAHSPSAAPSASPSPPPREAVSFHMADFDRGWLKYADGTMTTADGGAHWQEAAADMPAAEAQPEAENAGAQAPDSLLDELMHTGADGKLIPPQPPVTITLGAKTYSVKQSQFLTAKIGWALLTDAKDFQPPLLVTADGGQTWHSEVTADIRAVMQEERSRMSKLKQESALYASTNTAKAAMSPLWTLLPSTASPGDVVLVRHSGPGQVEWLGKTYKLQAYGAGYFTYLPITMQAKPGTYPIGDQTLTVQAKKFETQYLQVTKQMESMKQDTQRIQADQKKIDLARSQSAAEFLFSSDFVQPIEGILTTPYGYTRYVNGKYDSSHLAIDLAAKEGTPIKATNDGVVALADSLYLTGNSIYIDHGMGLFSQYAHLSELRVKTGDKVKRGDIIGLVGTTGFSTGPHLHFTFWAHNVQVNPNLFFNTNPFHWLKTKEN